MAGTGRPGADADGTEVPYRAGCTVEGFEDWWLRFGQALVGQMNAEQLGMAAFAAGLSRHALPSAPQFEYRTLATMLGYLAREMRGRKHARISVPTQHRGLADSRFDRFSIDDVDLAALEAERCARHSSCAPPTLTGKGSAALEPSVPNGREIGTPSAPSPSAHKAWEAVKDKEILASSDSSGFSVRLYDAELVDRARAFQEAAHRADQDKWMEELRFQEHWRERLEGELIAKDALFLEAKAAFDAKLLEAAEIVGNLEQELGSQRNANTVLQSM